VDQHRSLSQREEQVLRMIVTGFSNKEAAARMTLSEKTVETYRVRGMAKLGCSSRVELTYHAVRVGWFDELRPSR
jgi:DNA-binding NarL/FixJ family response regulator